MGYLEKDKDNFGSFNDLDEHALPFFQRHISEFADFCNKRQASSVESLSILELLKLFIRERKLPFDMRHYMNAQSEFIRQYLQKRNKAKNRQEIVSLWIRENAEKHRDLAVERQCQFLDAAQSHIVPQVEKMLDNFKKFKKR